MDAAPGGVNGHVPPAPMARSAGPAADAAPAEREQPGTVRIAQRVLRTVVEEAALGVPGVARMARGYTGWPASLAPLAPLGRARPQHGVALDVRGEQVAIDLYLIMQPDVNLVEVGMAVQDAVSAAVEHILGMHASEVNVYVRDVA